MVTLLVFAITLLVAVLVSERANRTVLSTAVLFLLAGVLVGGGGLGLVPLSANDRLVRDLAELALFSVLFTDGMQAGVRDLAGAWRLPARALLLGLPLTLLGTALFAHLVAGLPWPQALLLGAVLSPTDPVFAAAIVGRQDVPYRLRQLLNVESGLNDGLALPVVVVLLSFAGAPSPSVPQLVGELLFGVVLGVAIPWAAVMLERLPYLAASARYEPLNAFAIGLLVLSVAALTHGNLFLAAFAGGMTVATVGPEVRSAFHRFGDTVTELLKLAALLVFGVLLTPAFLRDIPASGYAFAALALFVVRPVAIGIALLGSHIPVKEWIAAAWFGPKGFASVVYGLLVLTSGIVYGDELFHLIALVTAASIVAHSSTDVLVARWVREQAPGAPEAPEEAA